MGILFALLTAFCWGLMSLLVRKGTFKIDPVAANLYSLPAGFVVVLLVGLFTGDLALVYSASPYQWLVFTAAGIVAFVLGRAVFYVSIARIGAGTTVSVSASSTLVTPLMAIVLFGEVVNFQLALGIILIFTGIFIITRRPS